MIKEFSNATHSFIKMCGKPINQIQIQHNRSTHQWLPEQETLLWVNPTGKDGSSGIQDVLAQDSWLLGHGERVHVHNAIEHWAALFLQIHPVLNGSKVVTQMRGPSWLDTRENPIHDHILWQSIGKINTLFFFFWQILLYSHFKSLIYVCLFSPPISMLMYDLRTDNFSKSVKIL